MAVRHNCLSEMWKKAVFAVALCVAVPAVAQTEIYLGDTTDGPRLPSPVPGTMGLTDESMEVTMFLLDTMLTPFILDDKNKYGVFEGYKCPGGKNPISTTACGEVEDSSDYNE